MAKIKGKWRWNDDVDTLPDSIYDLTADVHFSSNGEEFSQLKVEKYAIPLHVVIYYDSIMVQRCLMNDPYDENSDGDFEIDEFLNETYRIMDFGETEQEISEELYAFIDANATECSPIAEKLEKIADNVRKVFEAGKQQGRGEGYDSGYDAGLEAGKELGGYNGGFEAGYSKSESDFWDVVQQNGSRTDYSWAFCAWGCEYLHPKHKVIPQGTDVADICYNMDSLKKIEAAYFDFSQVDRAATYNYSFGGSATLEEIEDVNFMPAARYNYTFAWNSMLKTIAKITADENTLFDHSFDGCYNLENITFAGVIGQSTSFNYCSKLSRASIESIVNHLSDSATGKTLTLSKAAVDEEFAFFFAVGNTSEEIPGTHPDNPYWWPLRNTKSNWEIAYV